MKILSALAWPLLLLLHAWPSVTLALEKAVVEVVIYEHSSGGDYTTHTYELEGKFSNAGAATSAEGDILEVSFLLLKMFSGGFGLTPTEGEQNFCHDQPFFCGFVYLYSLQRSRTFDIVRF